MTPAFGERVDQWREASIISALTKEGKSSPLVRTPLLLLTAEEDFHFGEDAQELEKWLIAAGHVSVLLLIVTCGFHVDDHSHTVMCYATAIGAAQGDPKA